MKLYVLKLIIVLLVLVLFAVSTLAAEKCRLISVRPDVALEIVDWGGQGQSLVLLAGLGHTAHVFDEFAPLFCDRYRVVGITRRGHGASSKPAQGYDLETLAEDIWILLDSLNIEGAIVAGHSVAGDEMTQLATVYPNKVKALIYIEATYDRTMTRDTLDKYPDPESSIMPPTADDYASVSRFMDYYEKAQGVRWPTAEVHALYDVKPDGSLGGYTIPSFVYQEIRNNLKHPDYSKIDVPALAIYGVDYPITELYPDFSIRDSVVQAQMRLRYDVSRRLDAQSRLKFREEMKYGKVVELPGVGHSPYLTNAEEVSRIMIDFLNEL